MGMNGIVKTLITAAGAAVVYYFIDKSVKNEHERKRKLVIYKKTKVDEVELAKKINEASSDNKDLDLKDKINVKRDLIYKRHLLDEAKDIETFDSVLSSILNEINEVTTGSVESKRVAAAMIADEITERNNKIKRMQEIEDENRLYDRRRDETRYLVQTALSFASSFPQSNIVRVKLGK